jgi:UDP-3-O-[3-hydroxymyristoyl] glucosamine N-acyltransferase
MVRKLTGEKMKLKELAEKIGGKIQGDGQLEIKTVASLSEASPDEISFLSDVRYSSELSQTKAAAVIVSRNYDKELPACAVVFVEDVEIALEELLQLWAQRPDVPSVGVHPGAFVDSTAKLAEGAAIGAGAVIGAGVRIGSETIISSGCVLGRDVEIGDNCYLWPNVVINYNCRIGNNVIIHANSTIGTDGFGYRLRDGRHCKVPHIGTVVIEDDVEIGANSCVDRAKIGRTVIGRGTKIDNLVMVAHNVHVGQHCILVAQVGIAGSSQLGNYVVLGGQSGVADHVKIGDQVMVAAKSAVTSDEEIKAKARLVGIPARDFVTFYRELSLIHKLPEMARELKQIKKQLNESASAKDNS